LCWRSFLFAGSLLASASTPVLALDADPYCVREPTVDCLLDMVASAIGDLRPGYRTDTILSDYGRALALTGREAEALAVAERIKTERSRNQVLKTLAAQQPGKGDGSSEKPLFDESIAAERRVVDYAMMAEAAFRKEKGDDARAFLDQALAAAAEVEAETKAPHGHYRLASALEMAGDHDAAEEAARAILDPSNSAITLIELATRWAKDGRKDEAHTLMAEAADLREALPEDKRYLTLSRAAEFWIKEGETERALTLARSATSDQVRESVLGGLVQTAARAGNWALARELAEEADAIDVLASVFGYCASSFVARGNAGPNTCLDEAHVLLDGLIRDAGEKTGRDRFMLDDAIVAVAVAESLSDNPEAVEKLIAALPDARSRQHAHHMIINAQTGRDNTLALLMTLNLETTEAKLEALARMSRFLAADANR